MLLKVIVDELGVELADIIYSDLNVVDFQPTVEHQLYFSIKYSISPLII